MTKEEAIEKQKEFYRIHDEQTTIITTTNGCFIVMESRDEIATICNNIFKKGEGFFMDFTTIFKGVDGEIRKEYVDININHIISLESEIYE